jgi:hypothetical protein
MELSMDEETPTQTITRLLRELDHVIEQSKVSHAMAMRWKARCLQAEEQCRRLQKQLQRKESKGSSSADEPLTDEISDEALSLPQVW